MKMLLLAVAMTVALSGCKSLDVINVLGGCVLPPALTEKGSVPDLDTSHDIPQEQANVLWAKDRSYGAKITKRHSDTVDYVAENCQ
jgi:hypothetical protein